MKTRISSAAVELPLFCAVLLGGFLFAPHQAGGADKIFGSAGNCHTGTSYGKPCFDQNDYQCESFYTVCKYDLVTDDGFCMWTGYDSCNTDDCKGNTTADMACRSFMSGL